MVPPDDRRRPAAARHVDPATPRSRPAPSARAAPGRRPPPPPSRRGTAASWSGPPPSKRSAGRCTSRARSIACSSSTLEAVPARAVDRCRYSSPEIVAGGADGRPTSPPGVSTVLPPGPQGHPTLTARDGSPPIRGGATVLPTGQRRARPTIPPVRSPDRTRRDSAGARRWRSVGWSRPRPRPGPTTAQSPGRLAPGNRIRRRNDRCTQAACVRRWPAFRPLS